MNEQDMPARIRKLKRNEGGYPVPWFVGYVDGKPDFRMIEGGKIFDAIRFNTCWICGDPLGAHKAFVIGPMCAINRISSEPPSHLECAQFAAIHCPFLSQPTRTRREGNKPEGSTDPVGYHLDRNPGAALVWVTRTYRPFKVGDGVLFEIGDPQRTEWYAHGREATRAEVVASIEGGFPELMKAAIEEGPQATDSLAHRLELAMRMVPK